MTSKSSSAQIQLELRIAQVPDHKEWVIFQVPGTNISAKVLAQDESLKEWQKASVGSVVQVRMSTSLAEHLRLYNVGGMTAGSPKVQPKNG